LTLFSSQLFKPFKPVIQKSQSISFFMSLFKSIKKLAIIFKVYGGAETYIACFLFSLAIKHKFASLSPFDDELEEEISLSCQAM